MKIKITLFSAVLLFFSCCIFSQTDVPAGNVSGTWTLSGSPYKILGHILVPNGQTLTIEPGVVVEFTGKYKLFCNGQILANGNESQIIKFTTSAENLTTGWLGIRFEDTPVTNGNSSFLYCQIENVKADISGNNTGGAFNFLNFSKCTIENCEINNNYTINGGPAIFGMSSSPVIKNNYFHDNSTYQGGDCVELRYTTSIIEGNTFTEGGILIYYSQNMSIINNHISESIEGAVTAFESNINISNNIFENNSQQNGAGGGAILLFNSVAKIEKNILRNNSSVVSGGAICCFSDFQMTATVISNNLIYGNTSGSSNNGNGNGGGAISCFRQSPTIVNNTISNNYASTNGGALFCNYGSSPKLYNNIIYDNYDNNSVENIYLTDNQSDPLFYNNNLQEGLNGIITNGNPMSGAYENNIDVAPVFIDAVNHNYQLASGSPCINAGMNTVTGVTLPDQDLTGNTRILQDMIDIGALEFQVLGTDDLVKESRITLYPNPAKDSIVFKEAVENVAIYDISGRLIREEVIPNNSLDITDLASGSYILKVTSEGIESSTKLIKK